MRSVRFRKIPDSQAHLQLAEIGPALNNNFGLDVGTTLLDPNLPRDGNWEQNVLIQHELRSGIAVTGRYYRRQYCRLQRSENLLVDPDRDYTPFTITAPRDPRLPNRGGEVIPLYNLNPDKLQPELRRELAASGGDPTGPVPAHRGTGRLRN